MRIQGGVDLDLTLEKNHSRIRPPRKPGSTLEKLLGSGSYIKNRPYIFSFPQKILKENLDFKIFNLNVQTGSDLSGSSDRRTAGSATLPTQRGRGGRDPLSTLRPRGLHFPEKDGTEKRE